MLSEQRKLLAFGATHLLEDVFLPLAIKTARLPAQTTLEDLCALDLEDPKELSTYTTSSADDLIRELILPGACGVAAALALTEQTDLIFDYIQRLIWKDAYERAQARELAFDTNIKGFDNSEYETAFEAAIQVWQGWEATNPIVKAETENFLELCTDYLLQ